jgi:hypothetical protein
MSKRPETISTGIGSITQSSKSKNTTETGERGLKDLLNQETDRKRRYKQAADLVKLQKGKLQRVSHDYLGLFPTCTWDLETSNLNASIGYLLCCVVKPWRQEPIVFRIDDSPGYETDRSNDRWLAKRIKAAVENYTVAIAYNGQRFDAPFLNTRLMLARLKPLSPTVKHLDPLYAARFRMRLHSRTMAAVAEALGIVEKKTPLEGRVWIQAAAGVKGAMDKVVHHCIKDVIVLEQVTQRLVQLMDLKFFLIR